MSQSQSLRRSKILVPAILLLLVGSLVAGVMMRAPRTPPAPLGASARVDGGLARINGVIPADVDGWSPDTASAALAKPPGEGLHRVRVLVELTALEQGGLPYDPSSYSVSGLGAGTWKALWFSPAAAIAVQGKSINATLVFELPDRAIDLTLDLSGGPGLSLGAGHHRGRT
ncbi:hypothetical protein [Pseudarthrobacter albicanus]|uniref:hypothetical protein n=1 Tax=Pseudarthrobacter albicanus TaxID=2823873 RepID=UPI001BAC8242|nr:hypothetical protein [Pseudarthrobacter albicanus]